jgi:hypothetical protein
MHSPSDKDVTRNAPFNQALHDALQSRRVRGAGANALQEFLLERSGTTPFHPVLGFHPMFFRLVLVPAGPFGQLHSCSSQRIIRLLHHGSPLPRTDPACRHTAPYSIRWKMAVLSKIFAGRFHVRFDTVVIRFF